MNFTIVPVGYLFEPPKKRDDSNRKRLNDLIFYEKYGKEVDHNG